MISVIMSCPVLPITTPTPRDYQQWLFLSIVDVDCGKTYLPADRVRVCDENYRVYDDNYSKYGGNSLVTLPTGKGKTLVASMIIKHWLTTGRCDGKAVFVTAPTRVLVDQQRDEISQNVGLLNSEVIHGGIQKSSNPYMELPSWDDPETWKKYFEKLSVVKKETRNTQLRLDHDTVDIENGVVGGETSDHELWSEDELTRVFFTTPAKLLELLVHGFVPYDRIGLIVFDEAHHSKQGDTINVIMENFNSRFLVSVLNTIYGLCMTV
eukprot:GHVQ01018358.1.p1 GENE.GHVQ01018358.1~~GHVQ01018358.1.p1  ORF type:complete len:266 (+),score=28.56 GHVQ01018358.1:452-1249(+)